MLLKGTLLGVFFMLFVTPYMMCKGVWMLAYDDIERSDKVKCMIPIYNLYLAERTYSGGFPTVFTATMTMIVVFIVRLVEVFARANETVAFVTVILLLVSILVWYILNAVFVFRVMHSAECNSTFMQILYSVIFPIGQYYIGNFLPRLLKYSLKEEDTFGG